MEYDSDKTIYQIEIEEYGESGMDMLYILEDFIEIKLKDMTDYQVKKEFDFTKECISRGYNDTGWLFILEDVLLKRRFEKINKIKKNIND